MKSAILSIVILSVSSAALAQQAQEIQGAPTKALEMDREKMELVTVSTKGRSSLKYRILYRVGNDGCNDVDAFDHQVKQISPKGGAEIYLKFDVAAVSTVMACEEYGTPVWNYVPTAWKKISVWSSKQVSFLVPETAKIEIAK